MLPPYDTNKEGIDFMADRIFIDTEDYAHIMKKMRALSSELEDCASALSRIRPTQESGGNVRINLSGSIRSISTPLPDGTVATCISRMGRIIRTLEDRVSTVERNVGKASRLFESTERAIANEEEDTYTEAPFAVKSFWQKAISIEHGGGWHKPENIKIGDIVGDMPIYLGISSLINRIASLHISGEVGASGSVFSGEFNKASQKGSIAASYGVFNGSASASGGAGMNAYQYGDYGESSIIYLPGAKGEAGVSASVFEAEGSATYEIIDNVEVGASGYAKVGEVSAKAEGQLGYADGEFGAYAKLEAEAIAGEIGLDASVDIAGIEGKVGGSVNYGIGAHAEAGYDDGVITVDLGVSVGVGASVSIELDIGGFVDNITDSFMGFAESVISSYM